MSKFKQVAFLFPGQGAQSVGMGHDFVEAFPEAREVFQEGDEILRRALSKIVFEGPLEKLTETQNSQSGIFLTSVAILHVLQKQFPSFKPKVCAGLSLGEYTAFYASKRLDMEQALQLVDARGKWMSEECEKHKGTMAALFGLSSKEVQEMVEGLKLPHDLWVANFNTPTQTVISGTLKGVEAGCEEAHKRGAKRVLPLQVHGAFHSGLMKGAQDKLAEKIAPLEFKESDIELVMNVPGAFVKEPTLMRKYLIEQVTSSVRWEQSIQAMRDVDLFVEIGSGKVLTGLNRQIGVTAPTVNVSKVSDLEVLAKMLE